jgi:hypothetical protein
MSVAMAANESPFASLDRYGIHLSDFAKFNRRETTHRRSPRTMVIVIMGQRALSVDGRSVSCLQPDCLDETSYCELTVVAGAGCRHHGLVECRRISCRVALDKQICLLRI